MAWYSKHEHGWHICRQNQELLRYGDRKVQIAMALSFALLSFSGGKIPRLAQSENWYALLLIVLFYLSSACFGYFSLLALFSRSDKDTCQKCRKLIFFGHVMQYKNSLEYAKEFENATSEELLRDLCHQNYHLAVIASKKYYYYKVSWFFLLIQVVCFLIIMLFDIL